MGQTEGKEVTGSVRSILGLLYVQDMPFILRETVEAVSLKLKRDQGLSHRSPGNYLGSVSKIS